MFSKESSSFSQIQYLGSILGLILPILQIFFQFIPGASTGIFLIKDYFLVISIFATFASYILVTVIRNYSWFEIPFSTRKHKEYMNQITRMDPRRFSQEEIRRYIDTNTIAERPFYFTPNNIFLILIPVVFTSFLVFFGVGLIGQIYKDSLWLIFIQGVSYVILISSTTLTLAIYYIRELNANKYKAKEKDRVKKIIQLAYENSIFDELPRVSLVAQWQVGDFSGRYSSIFKVANRYYLIGSDDEANKILTVDAYNTYQDLLTSIKEN